MNPSPQPLTPKPQPPTPKPQPPKLCSLDTQTNSYTPSTPTPPPRPLQARACPQLSSSIPPASNCNANPVTFPALSGDLSAATATQKVPPQPVLQCRHLLPSFPYVSMYLTLIKLNDDLHAAVGENRCFCLTFPRCMQHKRARKLNHR